MTPSELIQGVLVRSAIVLTLVTFMLFMALFELHIIDIQGLKIPFFSIAGVVAIVYFQAATLKLDHPAMLMLSTTAFFILAISQRDMIPGIPIIGSVSFLSLVGILAIQQPFAVWVLNRYQKIMEKTQARIDIEVANVDAKFNR